MGSVPGGRKSGGVLCYDCNKRITCKIKSVFDRQDSDAFMCSVFIFLDLHYYLYSCI